MSWRGFQQDALSDVWNRWVPSPEEPVLPHDPDHDQSYRCRDDKYQPRVCLGLWVVAHCLSGRASMIAVRTAERFSASLAPALASASWASF